MEVLASNEAVFVWKDKAENSDQTIYGTHYKQDAYWEFFWVDSNSFTENRIERALNEKGFPEFSAVIESTKGLTKRTSLEENLFEFNGRVYSVRRARREGTLFCITVQRKIPIEEINNYPSAHFLTQEGRVQFDGCEDIEPEDFKKFLKVLENSKPANQQPKLRRVK